MLNKLGSFLGTLAFFILMGGIYHMNYEAHHHYTPPPSLSVQLKSVVSISDVSGAVYCSGWVLAGTKTIVTAAHCNDDPTAEMLVDFGDGEQHKFHVQKKGDADYKTGPDLMTLYTNDTSIKWPVGLPVCGFKPYYGEELHLMGGPLSYDKTVSFGAVSKPSRTFDEYLDLGPNANDLIQYDGQLLPGNSGGPAVDTTFGCVMGVGELLVSAQPEIGLPYGLNFLTPAADLGKLK